MAGTKFTPNPAGFKAVLNSPEVRSQVHALAETVAENIRAELGDEDIAVDDYTTDRAASSIILREVDARLHQARDGLFTRAAAQAGLEVVEK